MKKLILPLLIMLPGLASLDLLAQANTNSKNCIPCAQLKNLRIPDVTIMEAKALKNDTIQGQVIAVPFCRLSGK